MSGSIAEGYDAADGLDIKWLGTVSVIRRLRV